jgi:hypothetical protein
LFERGNFGIDEGEKVSNRHAGKFNAKQAAADCYLAWKRSNMNGMKKIMLKIWMVFCLIVGGYIVLTSPFTLIGVIKASHGNVPYIAGGVIMIAIGVLLLGEFNRARKSLKRPDVPPTV